PAIAWRSNRSELEHYANSRDLLPYEPTLEPHSLQPQQQLILRYQASQVKPQVHDKASLIACQFLLSTQAKRQRPPLRLAQSSPIRFFSLLSEPSAIWSPLYSTARTTPDSILTTKSG